MVPGEAVKLSSETTNEVHEAKSNGEGLFSFTAVPRDSYRLRWSTLASGLSNARVSWCSANEHVRWVQ